MLSLTFKQGATHGNICTGAGVGDCTDANNVCDTNCRCADNFFPKTSPAECASQIALNANCDTAQTSADQCTGSDVECRADSGTDKCLCKATHYDNSGTCATRTALNGACTTSAQCAANTDCRDDSGTDKCLCTIATHYLDTTCVAIQLSWVGVSFFDNVKRMYHSFYIVIVNMILSRMNALTENFQVALVGADQCVTHATCDTVASPTKCECDTGYTATPTASPTMCSANGVVKFASLSYMYVVPILVSMMSLLR
ncbi:unnamed protein product [Mytilus edulis]|uniref:Uncharacterized protein n=1 Tax=Mytilus edulis TaxID=6550 RepID=A0A8S3SIP4_MYTED|nr:unnamed protein product [Mytilus edulis]